MEGELVHDFIGAVGVQLLHRVTHPTMELAPLSLELRAVRHLLDERVPEQVDPRPTNGTDLDEALLLERAQVREERRRGGHAREHLMLERPADDRRRLQRPPRSDIKPVEPGDQELLNGLGHLFLELPEARPRAVTLHDRTQAWRTSTLTVTSVATATARYSGQRSW